MCLGGHLTNNSWSVNISSYYYLALVSSNYDIEEYWLNSNSY